MSLPWQQYAPFKAQQPYQDGVHPHRTQKQGFQKRPRFPYVLKNLDVICHPKESHEIPIPMQFLSESISDHGDPMAVYYCPITNCTWREGWVIGHRSGKPRRLWQGYRRT